MMYSGPEFQAETATISNKRARGWEFTWLEFNSRQLPRNMVSEVE